MQVFSPFSSIFYFIPLGLRRQPKIFSLWLAVGWLDSAVFGAPVSRSRSGEDDFTPVFVTTKISLAVVYSTSSKVMMFVNDN